jgi:hypothetical protein
MAEDPQSRERKPIDLHFVVLFCALLVMMVAPSAVGADSHLRDVIVSGVLLAGAYAVSRRRATLAVGGAIAALSLVTLWFHSPLEMPTLFIVHVFLSILFLAFISAVILRSVLLMHEANLNTIFGALCVYILAGVMWAYIYAAVQIFQFDQDPFGLDLALTSAANAVEMRQTLLGSLMYHSFVTLTTLGYGDIVPATPLARSLCVIEAVMGQIYLVVLVADLVGLHVGARQRERHIP